MDEATFEDECQAFVEGCVNMLHCKRPFQDVGFHVPWMIDHVCYKCESNESYRRMYEMLSGGLATEYDTSYISGRKIATMIFTTPIVAYSYTTRVLELSDQKPDGSQKEGFDHIEIVPVSSAIMTNTPYRTDDITLRHYRAKVATARLVDKIRTQKQSER